MLSNSNPRRKGVRKGTRSCWECRRRKVKCLPSPDDISICAGCRERGTKCLSQHEYVDDPSPQPGDDPTLAQRVARIESLLETLVKRITQGQDGESTSASMVATTDVAHRSLPNSPRPKGPGVQAEDTDATTERLDSLRQRLAAMLPCQADVDFLFASSHGWWLLQQHMMPQLPDITKVAHRPFNVSTVCKGHPLQLARLLLCIAICIQQLPPQMDTRVLQTAVPVREIESGIIEFITKKVTSDDELTVSMEGVECLALLGMYAVNAGNLRRSWLLFRKAITVGQCLGIHRMALSAPQDTMEVRRRHLWYQIARGERYLSTILGLPSSTTSAVFTLDNNPPCASPADLYHKKLYHISGLILDRNQADSMHSFSTTLRISEQVDSFAAQMPPAWWEIPTTIATTRTRESSSEFERIMCQIWHFELVTLLHLPFMLRATNEGGFEYSRNKCLNAARNLVKRWVSIRESHTSLLFSNLLEFQAFTAAITLLLGLLAGERSALPTIIQERNDDSQLVERVVANFEKRTCSQSIHVIRTLQRFLQPGDPSDRLRLEIPFFGVIRVARSGAAVQAIQGERLLGATSGHDTVLRHAPAPPTMTPAETATVVDSASVCRSRKRTQQEMVGDEEEGYTDNSLGGEEPLLHISSNHFHLPPAPDSLSGGPDSDEWDFRESDMVFFDSLVNSDLVGDWTL
ncbi:hypothetical protein BJX68DRAFT_275279 [Aspergillus pseudodeflectus]|uniref:Zn(2)-C6 fungal-type domain-containing protein n=1 Tax=Aspergillus pseudodeflectus TaxID=176178 RepID=A0ABR4KGC0_9EURO